MAWQGCLAQIPGASFGQYPGDNYLHFFMIILTFFVPLRLIRGFLLGESTRWTLLEGFLFLLLDDLLMICFLAEGEGNRCIWGPIRHSLHISAIHWIIVVYWQELRDQ